MPVKVPAVSFHHGVATRTRGDLPSTSSLIDPNEGRRLLDLERSGEEQDEFEDVRERPRGEGLPGLPVENRGTEGFWEEGVEDRVEAIVEGERHDGLSIAAVRHRQY